MRYRLHFLDSRGNVSATLELRCRDDTDAIALLRDISPIYVMELWQAQRLVFCRDVPPELVQEHVAFDPETTASYSALEDLDHRIQDCERNLILVRADFQRLTQAKLATDLAENLMLLLTDTLETMMEYRQLLRASIRNRTSP
jgi:hypothetical protein